MYLCARLYVMRIFPYQKWNNRKCEKCPRHSCAWLSASSPFLAMACMVPHYSSSHNIHLINLMSWYFIYLPLFFLVPAFDPWGTPQNLHSRIPTFPSDIHIMFFGFMIRMQILLELIFYQCNVQKSFLGHLLYNMIIFYSIGKNPKLTKHFKTACLNLCL